MNASLLCAPIQPDLVAACLLALLAPPAPAAMEFDTARLNEIAARLPPRPAAFGAPISDRAAWDKLARTAAFGRIVSSGSSLFST